MESSLIRDPRILEALEACRPGSDDLTDPAMEPLARQMGVFPELARLYERVQRTDRALVEAFGSVRVPSGLPDRIRARLSAVPRVAGGSPRTTYDLPPTCESVPSPVVGRWRWRRRGWWLAAGVLAAAASVLVAVFLRSPQPAKFSNVEQLLNEAMVFFDTDARGTGTLRGFGPPPPADYPLAPSLPTRSCLVRWREIKDFLGSHGVAYDLTSPNGVSATLYVVRLTSVANLTSPGLEASRPDVPRHATGGRSAAVWQEGDLLYVLVVEGESWQYERFIRELATGPVT